MTANSTRLRHRLWPVPLALVSVLLAVILVPAAAASDAGQPAVMSPTSTARPTLRYGSCGPAVVYLQQRLTALRYDLGPVDGVFGYRTLHGVYAFQKVQGISVDGVETDPRRLRFSPVVDTAEAADANNDDCA